MTDQPTGHLDPETDIEEPHDVVREPDLTEPDESVHPALDTSGDDLEEPEGKEGP